MLSIMYYFFQVILCSGLLMGYYWLLLRNKRFHQYNRFYLLAVAFLSWIVPLIKIRWTHNVIGPDQQVARLLSVVADGNTQIEEIVKGRGSALSWGAVVTAVYILVAAVLLTGIIRALFRLYRLLQVNSCKTVGDIYLIFTQAKGTPFSFFRYIFWNDEIDIRSNSGKQILEHELTHVKEKHSYDKLFIQLMLVAGWFNPFFWLLKKEMEMIHEFIADKKAVADGDTASLADMLLTTVFPQQQYRLTHPFFFSPVKRRLQMLTNTSHPRFTYIRRLIVLPLLAAMVILFSFRNKEFGRTNLSLATVVDHVIDNPTASLMIDHVDRLLLKPVNGSRDSVRLFADTIMVCDGNGLIQKAYGNITIADKGESGLLGEALIVVNGTKADHTILETIHPDDIDRIDILKDRAAVDIYGDAGKNGVVLITTKNQSDPANTSSLTSYSQKGEDVTLPANRVSEVTIAAPGFKKADPIVISPKYNSPDWSVRAAWVKEDGKVKETFNNPTKNEIKLSAEDYAITWIQYPGLQPEKTIPAEMETNQEQDPAQFPGGEIAWKKYLERNLNRELPAKNGAAPGNYMVTVSFVVDKEGMVSDVRAENDPGYGTKAEAIRIIEKGPKWKPATVNGKAVVYRAKRVIAWEVTENGQPSMLPIQEPARFPGGQPAWERYLTRNLNKDIVTQQGGKPGKYEVVVSFVVDKEGKISDVRAENDPGYGTKAEAIRMIAKGPKWVPAKLNGKPVIYRQKQTISWEVKEKNTVSLIKSAETDQTDQASVRQAAFYQKLAKAKQGNTRIFFNIDRRSCVTGKGGSAAWTDGLTDIVIVNGKRITPDELNRQYKRSDFIVLSAKDLEKPISKEQTGILLVSSRLLSQDDISKQMALALR